MIPSVSAMVSAMRWSTSWALTFLTTLACAGRPAPKTTSAFAPTPYTAEQLRAAMPVGHVIRVAITAGDQPPVEDRWEVVAATPEGCTITSTQGPPQTSDWEELRDHAKFPAAATVITDGTVDVGAGHFATKHYVVAQPDGSVETFDFDVARAGPPLLLLKEKDGKLLVRFETLERK